MFSGVFFPWRLCIQRSYIVGFGFLGIFNFFFLLYLSSSALGSVFVLE